MQVLFEVSSPPHAGSAPPASNVPATDTRIIATGG